MPRHADLSRQAQTQRCPEHPDQVLVVAMTPAGADVVCHSCGGRPKEMAVTNTVRQQYRRGMAVPAALTTHLKGDRMTSDASTALVLRDLDDVAIAEHKRKLSAIVKGFGELDRPEVMLAAQLMDAGFQPSHLNILHGHLYLNLDGRAFWTARALGAAYGGTTHRPMTPEERDAYQLEKDEVGVVATLWKVLPGGTKIELATDIGRAGGTRDARQAVAKGNKAEMAIKRARHRAMRAGAPLGVNIGVVDQVGQAMQVVGDEADGAPTYRELAEPVTDQEGTDAETFEWPDDEDEGDVEVEDEAQAEEELDLSAPAGPSRVHVQADEYVESHINPAIRAAIEAGRLKQSEAWRLSWDGLKGRKAVQLMATEGWSAAQVVAIIEQQARPPAAQGPSDDDEEPVQGEFRDAD